MDKLNKTLEDFLKKITPNNNARAGIECLLDYGTFEEIVQVNTYLADLEEKGFLRLPSIPDGIRRTKHGEAIGVPYYFTLTSKGETYFAEIEKQEKAEKLKKWSDRAWQLATIFFSVTLSAAVSFAISALR